MNGSTSFGNNYPRNWNELDRFADWYIAADFEDQRTEEDIIKGHETAEAFIHQWNELWFPRLVLQSFQSQRASVVPNARVRAEAD